ncbi:MAG TPA: hypothetical protein VLT33_42520 [Labilithrix sp.]|nr:hypothetical protein [Labilithrix sp.]
MLDKAKLRADLGALARECRALKDLLGETWTRPMADEQRHLARLRWRVTELCVLRAWSRGKKHVRKAPRSVTDGATWDGAAWHAKIAERVAKDYERPVEAIADGVEGAAQ